MTNFNPLYGSILQTPQVQQRQAAEKSSQIRRTQMLRKNVAMQDEQLQEQVESSEEIQPTHSKRDEEGTGGRRRQPPLNAKPDEEGHLDVTA